MAQIEVVPSDTFEVWRQKTNQISDAVGDPAVIDPALGQDVIGSVNTVNQNLETNVARLDSKILAIAIALG